MSLSRIETMKDFYYKGINLKDKIYLYYLRNLSFHPGRRKLRRYLTNHFFNNGIGVKSNFSAKFRVKTFDFIDQKIIFEGCYEPETLSLCYSLVGTKDIFLDVGSNFGLYAINLASKSGIQVIAIEPNPSIFYRLQNNKILNDFNNIFLINVAVGEKSSIAGMDCPSLNNSGNYQISQTSGDFYVAVLPLQDILNFLSIQRIKLLKIDIEGFELFALKGIDWNIVDIQNIVMEFIPEQLLLQNTSSFECLQFLIEKGYSPFKIDGSLYHTNDFIGPESNLWLKKIR
jgi:FkbM family methyltransferase